MDENILTPDQVAQKLQVHPFTVLKFIKQGKLKASKLGRVYRIRESDVSKFLDEQSNGSAGSNGPRNQKSESKTTKASTNGHAVRTSTASSSKISAAEVATPSPIPDKELSPVSVHLEPETTEETLQKIKTANISTTRTPTTSNSSVPVPTTSVVTQTNTIPVSPDQKSKTTEKKTILPEEDDFLELDHYILD